MKHRATLLIAASLCFVASQALGHGAKGKHAVTSGMSAQTFAKKAGGAGLAEVEISRIALEKSQNSDVKAFAQMMVDDHGKANSELSSLASTKNLQVPTSLDAQHRSVVARLRSKSGAAFDRAYVTQMTNDHHKAVDLFQKAAQNDSLDADVRQFAEKTLPTLQHHKQEADDLASRVGVGGSKQSRR